jgi:hypothetical protein
MDGQTDRHDEAKGAFRNFAKRALKKTVFDFKKSVMLPFNDET